MNIDKIRSALGDFGVVAVNFSPWCQWPMRVPYRCRGEVLSVGAAEVDNVGAQKDG